MVNTFRQFLNEHKYCLHINWNEISKMQTIQRLKGHGFKVTFLDREAELDTDVNEEPVNLVEFKLERHFLTGDSATIRKIPTVSEDIVLKYVIRSDFKIKWFNGIDELEYMPAHGFTDYSKRGYVLWDEDILHEIIDAVGSTVYFTVHAAKQFNIFFRDDITDYTNVDDIRIDHNLSDAIDRLW